MKNLMTRKLLFGMLVTFVLAFSVQGIADALTFEATRTGDLQDIVRGGLFSVTFAVTLETEDRKPAYTDYIVDPDDSTRYFLDSTSGDKDNDQYDSGERTVSTSTAFYYNSQAVKISVSGAGAKITSIGFNNITPADITPATSITLKEGGSGAEALAAGSIVVNCSTSSYGEVTITASDATPSEDYPSGVRKAPNFVLTTYAVRYNNEVGPTRTIRLVGVTNGVAIGYDNQRDQPIYNGDSSHYPVTYEVEPGSGMLYIQEGDRTGSPTGEELITSSAAKVFLSMGGSTNTVTAQLGGSFEKSEGIYIFGNPQLKITSTDHEGDPNAVLEGDPNAVLDGDLEVTLTDNAATPAGVVGVPIKFDVTDKSPSGGILSPAEDTTIVDASNEVISSPRPGSTMYVRTIADGVASATFQLGTIPGEQTVTAGALGIARLTQTIKATATGTAATRQLFAEDIDRQGTTNIYTLIARVENGGQPASDQAVMFSTTKGLLTGDSMTAKTVTAVTNAAGKARVTYNIGDSSGNAEVVASISVLAADTTVTQLQEAIFNVRGGGTPPPPPPGTVSPRLNVSTSSSSAAPGTQVIVTASLLNESGTRDFLSGIPVTFTASTGSFSSQTVNTNNGTAQSIFTAPSGVSIVTFTLTANNYLTQQASITVTGVVPETSTPDTPTVSEPATIEIYDGDDQEGEVNRRLDEDFVVQVLDRNNNGVSFELVRFRVVEGSGRVSPSTARTDRDGLADVTFTPRSQGTIEVEAYLGDLSPVTFTITTGEPPDAIVLFSGNNQSGRPGAALANPFIVEVIDANDDAVSGVAVTFAVTAGGGTLSATSATTNANGRAQTTLTLGDAPGDNTVTARVTGLTGVTFKATSGSQVLVNASQRAPMYWISRADGKLHRLVDDEIENLAPNVTGVTSLAVDSANGLLYFGVKTGENRGAIRSANLNGRNVRTLKTLTSVPTGIAIDSAGGTVYWTNSRGRIQSIPTEGSTKITNVLQNLPNPMALVLSNGHLYWGEPLGRLRRMNLTAAQKIVQSIATGLGEPLSLSIAKGKLYWTERDADGSGSVQRSNLDGSSIQEIKTFASGVPIGLVVDSADNKIYWTKGAGKIQRSNLAGRFVRDIATGIMNPGDIALGTEAADEPVVEQTTQTTRKTQTADTTKYDVNGDGLVDNIDVTLVAVALGTTNAKYDVNGDGTVDVSDLRAVIANTDDDAAAPAIDVDFTALNVDMIQEQIDILLASSDTSLAGQRTLAYLQHILASARPDETVLLANYPNPFNPETWIPYHLATGTDVQVNIYNTQGTLVRMLTLGHQSAGYYTSRSRAAYWDGRNALGERVASGIYFYQLQTDKISQMRKMVILK